MSHIIQTFRDWKRVNEDDDVPGKEKQKGKKGNRIIYIPIDRKTLKLKIINETDVIDADGYLRVTSEGVHAFDELLRLIKGQAEIIDYYKGLNDLINNIVIYEVDVDRGSRKQVITFRIESKLDLTAGDTSKRINSSVRYVRSDQLRRAMEGALINVDKTNPITSDQNVKSKFKLPFSAASITGSTDANLKQFIVDAYNIVKRDPKISTTNKLMKRVKDETKAGTLGVASKLFIKALNASLIIKGNVGLLDAVYREDIEENITQTLYDFIMNAQKALGESNSFYLGLDGNRIFEAESEVIAGFDTDAFIAVANTITPDTGDIKVPEGGFTEGMKGNAELAKFQKLLYTKFKKVLGEVKAVAYVNFAAKTGDGKGGNPIGDYGKTTSALVELIKTGLSNPYWLESRDGRTISAEFIKRIQDEKISESTVPQIYLGLDGKSIMINEDFGVPAGTATVSNKPAQKTQTKTKSTASSTSNVSGTYTLPDAKGWLFKVGTNGAWQGIDTNDKDDTWGDMTGPAWITDLIKKHGRGSYLNVSKKAGTNSWKRNDNNNYWWNNGQWQILQNGKLVNLQPGPVVDALNATYVTRGLLKKSGSSLSSGMSTPADIDKRFRDLANSIKTFVEGPNFTAYDNTGTFYDDDEVGAWKEVLYPQWTNTWKPTLDKINSDVKNSGLISAADKSRYATSYANILDMFTKDVGKTFIGGVISSSFYAKFLQQGFTDTFDLRLLLSGSKSEPYPIKTDF